MRRSSSISSSSLLLAPVKISWPTESALVHQKPKSNIIISNDDKRSSQKSILSATPLTRAKARWLLNRGAVDSEVAKVAIQSSATWAAACDALVRCCFLSSNNNSSRNNVVSSSGNDQMKKDLWEAGVASVLLDDVEKSTRQSILTSELVETLTHRLIQEVKTRGTSHEPVHSLEELHQSQIEQILNATAAEEVDSQPKDAWIDEGLEEKDENENDADADENEEENTNDDDDDDMMNNTTTGTTRILDMPFSVALSKANTGTIRKNMDSLVSQTLDFCKEQKVPLTAAMFNQLSLLPNEWSTALTLVSESNKRVASGTPSTVIESAMRSCISYANKNIHNDSDHDTPKIAEKVLDLYQKLTKEEGEDANVLTSITNSENVSSVAVSYAFHALSILSQKQKREQVQQVIASSSGEVETGVDHENGTFEDDENRPKNSNNNSNNKNKEASSASSNPKTHWQWTIQLHKDVVDKQLNTDKLNWFLSGDAGSAVVSSSVLSAASQENWSLALSILKKNVDTIIGVTGGNNNNNSMMISPFASASSSVSSALAIPDADSLVMTISACASCGRFQEVEKLLELGGQIFPSSSTKKPKTNTSSRKQRDKTAHSCKAKKEEEEEIDEFAEIFGESADDNVADVITNNPQEEEDSSIIDHSLQKQRLEQEQAAAASGKSKKKQLMSGEQASGSTLLTAVDQAFALEVETMTSKNNRRLGNSSSSSSTTKRLFNLDEDGNNDDYDIFHSDEKRDDNQKAFEEDESSSAFLIQKDRSAIFRAMKLLFVGMLENRSNWTLNHCIALATFAEKGASGIISSLPTINFSSQDHSGLLTKPQKENLLLCRQLALAAFEEYQSLADTMLLKFFLAAGRAIAVSRYISSTTLEDDKCASTNKEEAAAAAVEGFISSLKTGGDVAELALYQVLDLTLEPEMNIQNPQFQREASHKVLMLKSLPFLVANILSADRDSTDEALSILSRVLNDDKILVSDKLTLKSVLKKEVALLSQSSFSTSTPENKKMTVADFFLPGQKTQLRRLIIATVNKTLVSLRARQQLFADDEETSFGLLKQAKKLYTQTISYDRLIADEAKRLPRVILQMSINQAKNFPLSLDSSRSSSLRELFSLYLEQLPDVRNHHRALKMMISSSSSTINNNNEDIDGILRKLVPASVQKMRMVFVRFLNHKYPSEFENEDKVTRFLLKLTSTNEDEKEFALKLLTRLDQADELTIKNHQDEQNKQKRDVTPSSEVKLEVKKKATTKLRATMFDRY